MSKKQETKTKRGPLAAQKTAFVKVSGDLVKKPEVIEWIKKLTRNFFTVICVGGGTQISAEFQKRGWPVRFGPLGRETESFAQRQLARDVLEKNQLAVQDLLASRGIAAAVIIPVLDIGSVLCPVNGDIFVRLVYLGFDRLHVLTYESRAGKKQKYFRDLPKVQVIGFPD